MNDINDFDIAIQARDAQSAAAIWNRQQIVGGNTPEMVIAVLIRLQAEIDALKDERDGPEH